MLCLACNEDKQPVHALHPGGGIIAQCPCGVPYPISTSQVIAQVLETAEQAESEVRKHFSNGVYAKRKQPEGDPCDVLAIARERLADVKLQLAKLEPLKREEARLERMIWAAEADE